MLAFYGNWSDPNMFDHSTYVEAILYGDYEKMPYLHNLLGCGNALTINYGDGSEYYFGGNPLLLDDRYVEERNAFNSKDASRLQHQYFTLIRNASDMQITISNADTGEIYYQKYKGETISAYFFVNGGYWENTQDQIALNWYGTDAAGHPLAEGTRVAVTATAVPEYYRNADGSFDYSCLGEGAFLTTEFTIDNTAPQILDMHLDGSVLTVSVRDNRHVASIAVANADNSILLAQSTPNQIESNVPVTVEVDLTNVMGNRFLLAVYDYAMNVTTYEVELDLPEFERPFFTAVDTENNSYFGIDLNCNTTHLATSTRNNICAAEFVDGYVFEISNNTDLYVLPDNDLNNACYLGDLDPSNYYQITKFLDLAFNTADHTLYGLFYSHNNYEAFPYLCTIDMYNGTLNVLGELSVDVSNLAIDDKGNFYSIGYDSSSLYTYTANTIQSSTVKYVGKVGHYATTDVNSLAWDHDADVLYWTMAGTMLKINHKTAAPTLMGYYDHAFVGLYIRPATWGDRFAPSSSVSHVTISSESIRTVVGAFTRLTARVSPWNVTDNTIIWTTSDASIATVDQNGVVTAHAEGTAVITAASRLNPSKRATCVVEVCAISDALNAVIWDPAGKIWISEFSANDPENYTKLHTQGLEEAIATMTVDMDGTIYAASLDLSSYYPQSNLYKLDPVTFKPTLIGPSTYAYMDLAPAPSMPGKSLAAVYGGSMLFLDADTGDYYEFFYMFENNLVGIAYAGSEPYQEPGYHSSIDWYFLVDAQGTVYLMGFMEHNGVFYYLDHPSTKDGIFTNTGIVSDTPYFSSLYYDGECLFYSCFNSTKDNSTLYAIDANGSVVTLGDFGSGVWPAGGLSKLNAPPSTSPFCTNGNVKPVAMETTAEISKVNVAREKPVSGSLNRAVLPAEATGEQDINCTESVPILNHSSSVSGVIRIKYDTSVLELLAAARATEAFAYSVENGSIRIAFASANEISANNPVAYLSFNSQPGGDHQLQVTKTQSNESTVREDSTVFVHGHIFTEKVTVPTCTEQGYTTYTCFCGESYVGSYTDPLDHNWDNGVVTREPTEDTDGVMTYTCRRCGETKTETIPVKDHVHSYSSVVTDPTCTKQGYTTHTCRCGASYVDSYTDPLDHNWDNGVVTREPTEDTDGVMTYTCRRCGETKTETIPVDGHIHSYGEWVIWKDPSSTEEGELRHYCECGAFEYQVVPMLTNPFVDVKKHEFFFEPVLWAAYHNITNGTTPVTFAPGQTCTRAQVVTFLWRAMGCPKPQSTEHPFTDIRKGEYYYDAVLWANETGITNGISYTQFGPAMKCSRAQIVTFLWRALDKPEPQSTNHPFVDVKSSDYFYEPVLWAVENGITNGIGYTTFCPGTNCTRGQIVTFLYRTFLESPEE